MGNCRKGAREMHWSVCVIIVNLICWVFLTILLAVSFKAKRKAFSLYSREYGDIKRNVSLTSAPAPFYNKLRSFRLWYWTVNAYDKALLITSLEFSAITAYLILDPTIISVSTGSSPQAVICLVISALTSTLKMTLRLDKVAKPYIDAARIMENAILEFEYGAGQSDKMDALVKANAEAERLISIYVE